MTRKQQRANQARAHSAETAIECVYNEEYSEQGSDEDVIDVLTDLLHLCNRDGYDFGELLKMAKVHYKAETR
jgi:hypothetical protein